MIPCLSIYHVQCYDQIAYFILSSCILFLFSLILYFCFTNFIISNLKIYVRLYSFPNSLVMAKLCSEQCKIILKTHVLSKYDNFFLFRLNASHKLNDTQTISSPKIQLQKNIII